MAGRKNAKAQKSNELDGAEFFAAIEMIEQQKGIPKSYMIEKITQALVSAYKRDHEGVGDNVTVEANEELGTVRMFVKKDVVETVDNPCTEMSLEEARAALPRAQLGDVLRIEIKPRNFGRIAAQTARQVIIQGMREAERGMIYDEFNSKEHEILTGVVTRVDPRSGAASLRIGSGGESTEAYLAAGEQVRGESIAEGMRLKVYVVEVRRSTKGPQVLLSRTHPGLVKRLFELEVPEIYEGTVEVKSIAREAGSRTKLAVWSAEAEVDAIGACVGPGGRRVNNVVEELGGEKVDIIKYSEDPAQYIAAALSPADVISVTTLEEGKSCRVVVPDDQLSLAIGKEGQNARLAAKLTGYKIDIKPASAPAEEEEGPEEEELFDIDGGAEEEVPPPEEAGVQEELEERAEAEETQA
ncbi:transcription termination/antitermination protein NusA [Pseudoflavonifractor sp. 524-17]|uniref:transcription termination factor NusA n=1 Tax=Pseudoflavonifractor sp. 524-17 TaxID=2304577 RepID=UPI001379D3B0|nr:transcription termination factor NusA [Pseudoflavonifractor sp. 524-17]NCE64725.1 transcription termination/antitermination protein NusA [Pseudoflavonifractor sp. 524-17]